MSSSLRPHGLAAYQAPPSMGFSRQEYCSGVSSPSPDLPSIVIDLPSIVILKTLYLDYYCFLMNFEIR